MFIYKTFSASLHFDLFGFQMVGTIQKPDEMRRYVVSRPTFEIFDNAMGFGFRAPTVFSFVAVSYFIDAKTNFKFSGSHRSPHQDRSRRNRLGRGSEPRPRRRSSSTGHAFRAGNYYYICVKNVAQNHGENFFCGL